MPRQTKSTNVAPAENVIETAVPSNVVVDEVTLAPPKKRAARAKKVATPAESNVLTANITEESLASTSADNTVPEGGSSDPLAVDTNEQSTDFYAKLQLASNIISSLKSDYRALERSFGRKLRIAEKEKSKKRKATKVRTPSGFVKPTLISNELASFLGKEIGTEMARTAVTRDINQYIRLHNLQDPANGRKINPDEKLKLLLRLGKDDLLTYFNLQKFMSPHFPKALNGAGKEAVSNTIETAVSAGL